MTTSRNNTIMSWMAYTDFLSRLRIAAGILLPLNTRTLLLYPGGRDCIGAAGVDAYQRALADLEHRQLIEKRQRHRANGSLTSNLYRLTAAKKSQPPAKGGL